MPPRTSSVPLIRSLYVKLLLSAMLIVALLMAVLATLQYQAYQQEHEKLIQHELQSDLTQLFSTQPDSPKAELGHAFSHLSIHWPNRQSDGLICRTDGKELWRDIQSEPLSHTQAELCQQMLSLVGNERSSFHQLTQPDGERYYFYSMRFTRLLPPYFEPVTFHVILIKSAAMDWQQKRSFQLRLLTHTLFIYFSAVLILILSTRWGLTSLRHLQDELDAISQQQKECLSNRYEKELEPLTNSLNRLLDNERKQTRRYQNTMNDLAHSLKTRLALIQATMEDQQLSPQARQGLNEQVSLMDNMIQYHLRRAVAGRQLLSSSGVDPLPVLQKILATMAKVYQHKRIHITLKHDEELTFGGEQDDLFELFGNLLDNAHKFAISQIAIQLQQIRGTLQIKIEDDGPGVDPVMREKVLQRGVRADNSSGQGIGLAVCHEIIDSYNGTLTISESALGGACFTLLLPS